MYTWGCYHNSQLEHNIDEYAIKFLRLVDNSITVGISNNPD